MILCHSLYFQLNKYLLFAVANNIKFRRELKKHQFFFSQKINFTFRIRGSQLSYGLWQSWAIFNQRPNKNSVILLKNIATINDLKTFKILDLVLWMELKKYISNK